jgi:TetR/AcrR family transcriptional repressor of nem operon
MDTRERILEAARYLFWERGYAATGINDILKQAQARSGSFYHFFAGKEALLNAVLESYVDALHPVLVAPLLTIPSDGITRVFALLAGYRERLIETGCTYGCPIGRLALEIDHGNAASLGLISQNFAAWTGAVEAFLRQDAARFPADTDFGELAQFVLTVMEGGVMQARAHKTIGPFDVSVRQLHRYIELLTG